MIIVIVFFVIFLLSPASFAFSNCQLKYDNDKRALPSFKGKCSVCHINPSGSGPVNAFGKAFADAGFKITDDLVAKFPDFFQTPKEEPKTTPAPTSSPQITPTPNLGAPSIRRVKPKKVKVNVQSMITVIGKNFVNESKAFIDNNEVITAFKSKAKLLIDFVLNSVGVHEVKVKNPDGQESNTVEIKAK